MKLQELALSTWQ